MPRPARQQAEPPGAGQVVAVVAATPADAAIAQRLADRLRLPLHSGNTDSATYVLLVKRGCIMLQSPLEVAARPVVVDFADARLRHRRLRGGGTRQPIARAVGLRRSRPLHVIDATAGLGRDAFILASLGADVLLLERSPLIAALLTDGLERGQADPELAPIIERMHPIETDSVVYLQGLDEPHRPDVVYLDPMYPLRSKSAKVKKEMIALQAVIGADPDAHRLLAAALRAARDRVVVKRPRGAPPLADRQADTSTGAGNTRFDIYLCRSAKSKDQ
jgi:16S rRNA (guanine1516-N2)-methyltransferase